MPPPSDHGDDRLDELESRVRALEWRLKAMEASALGHAGASPSPTTPGPPAVGVPPMAPAGPRAPAAPPVYWNQPQSGTVGPDSAGGVPGWGSRSGAATGSAAAKVGPAAATVAPAAAAVGPAAATVGPAAAAAPGIPGGQTDPSESAWGVGVGSAISWSEIEERITGRALAWGGGIALIAGAIFFLSLAFSRGWIGPELRVVIGLVAGVACLAVATWLFERRGQEIVAHVVVAVGLGTLSLALIAATRLYELIPIEVGLGAALVVAIAAAVIAVRANSQAVAVFALIATLIAPPLMGASPDLVTILFLATTLVGTTAIALVRSWALLPGVAFLFVAPQLWSWLVASDTNVSTGLGVLAAFWLINEVAAGGEEWLRRSRQLKPATASLIVGNAAYALAGGFVLLDGSLVADRGAFLAALALAHFVVGGVFLRAEGDRHLFGLLVTGTGLASLTIAVPVQFGGPVVPIAWAAEAAALMWVRARRDHVFSGLAAAVLFGLAVGDLTLNLLPASRGEGFPAVPFADPLGMATLFVVGALALAAGLVRVRWERATVAAVAIFLLIVAFPFQSDGIPLLAGWSGLALVGIGLERRFLGGDRWDRKRLRLNPLVVELAESSPWWMGLLAGLLAYVHALTTTMPLNDLAIGMALLPIPFRNEAGLAMVILVGATLAAGFLDGRQTVRSGTTLIAGGIVAYGVVFQVLIQWAVAVWSGLAIGYAVLANRRPNDRWFARMNLWLFAADLLIILGTLTTLALIAPPDRLIVDGSAPVQGLPFLNTTSVALVALVAALSTEWYLLPSEGYARVRLLGGMALTVYVLSVGLVDVFEARIGGSVALEELAKQAQVALSVLWAVLGAGAFAVGLWRRWTIVRQAGLGLLALTTVKVFLVDLAALDVAYRVLSLVALGVLLLISAYAYQRSGLGRTKKEPAVAEPDEPDGAEATRPADGLGH